MSLTETIYFNTNIINPYIRVISLSDIHGDIQSLIIALRDCAKVIRKKEGFVFDPDVYDENLESELMKDLNSSEDYVEDLNYEWIGNNDHVVICGDFIDPIRMKTCKKHLNYECSYYPQIELKIFMFINAINNQIKQKEQEGKIIKLLGNHELGNILIPENFSKYYSDMDKNQNYYKGINRANIFEIGNPGFKMLFEGGCGILVKINNVIYVHGSLAEKPYSYYDKINQFLNNPINHFPNKKIFWNEKMDNFNESTSMLWDRTLGNSSAMSERIKKGINEQNIFCDKLIKLFTIFVEDNTKITENPNDLSLVVGHCIQSDLSVWQDSLDGSNRYEYGITFNKLDPTKSDKVSDVYNQEIYTGRPNFSDRSTIFGITMECKNSHNDFNKIYRIDIGSSRGYDYFREYNGKIYDNYSNIVNNPEIENKLLYSKTPQVLIFNTDNTVDIVKSKIKNTRIHLPRPLYENIVNKYDALNINNPDNENYKKKYLKYKNKYLQLKQLNNSTK